MMTKVSVALIAVILAIIGSAAILSVLNFGGADGWIFRVVPAGTVSSPVQTTIGTITINAPLPPTPATVPLYHGYYGPNDKIDYSSPNRHTQNSIPEVSEVPQLAEKALAPYGGIPPDAIVTGIGKMGGKATNLATGEVVAIYWDSTNIAYSRKLNGMPVVGSGGQMILLDFGDNGELLHMYKKWLTLNQIDEVPVISASQAVNKLLRGETLNAYQELVDVTITNITLGYYTGYPNREEETLEPVWILSGPTSHGDGLEFYVDARVTGSSLQFGNFTASPRYGTAPLTVSFTDKSTGPVWAWHWDFGDGTLDWTQNPTHIYQNRGLYTVKLFVSDDERDNLIERSDYILIGKKAVVTQTGTKLDELIATINAMNLDQGMKNSLTQKLENAQSKNADALKFIDQNKEPQANNMLNAEDNLMNAFLNEVDAQSGKTVSTVDAAKLKDGATEIRGFVQKAIETLI